MSTSSPSVSNENFAGLSTEEARARLRRYGRNRIRGTRVTALAVVLHQFENPLLLLLFGVAILSIVLGEHTDAAIVLAIALLSAGLGFVNEYRASSVLEALRAHIRRTAAVLRDGHATDVDVEELVPGDIVKLEIGDIVPADARLLASHEVECDQSIITGESDLVPKSSSGDNQLAMGSVVKSGTATAVVTETGGRSSYGQTAFAIGRRVPETVFQIGLRRFSVFLVAVTAGVSVSVFVASTVFLHRQLWESLLFALAIAVSLAPQLLPAIVTISLSTGAQFMARAGVVVKRLIAIEDLGNIEILFTDKTGTLTEGKIAYERAAGTPQTAAATVHLYGLLCNSCETSDGNLAGGNALDRALWTPDAPAGELRAYRRLDEVPFDFERRIMSVLVDGPQGRMLISKGAPESILARCKGSGSQAAAAVNDLFDQGARLIAVATRPMPDAQRAEAADEVDLEYRGLLVFSDPLKSTARQSLDRLNQLGISVKIVTGDNERVARKIATDLGFSSAAVLTGAQVEAMPDAQLRSAIPSTPVFARVSPMQKARIIRMARANEFDVGFLGDGVNDAVALHEADVGISVADASDVAKEAADVVMLTKDLEVLANGVREGRRVFLNTIKYILMATSSNFGNMISTAAGSLVLPFLPMLPSQVLLSNLLYDASEMTIPTDRVDEERLAQPSRWNHGLITRFMLIFGPLNASMDLSIFAVMALVLHVGAPLFRTAFFVESFITQTIVIFALRTQRSMFKSRPSLPLTMTTLGCVAVGLWLPYSPLAASLGFVPLSFGPLGAIAILIATYVVAVEIVKRHFFKGT